MGTSNAYLALISSISENYPPYTKLSVYVAPIPIRELHKKYPPWFRPQYSAVMRFWDFGSSEQFQLV